MMSDLCPHRGVALSAGKLVDDCIQCPFHGFEYDTSEIADSFQRMEKTQSRPKPCTSSPM
ncbi:MAG: Rieske (2Fe-2S) protein [Anaerolineales bacterium]|nr:Rieske (2Fe-2S) protein [Anaerolineales bacterium]